MNLTEEMQKHRAILMEGEKKSPKKVSAFEKELKKTEKDSKKKKTVKEEKEDFRDALTRLRRKAEKEGNPYAAYYYSQLENKQNLAAFGKYETFINSWAGEEWLKKTEGKIRDWAERENKDYLSVGRMGKWKISNVNESAENKPIKCGLCGDIITKDPYTANGKKLCSQTCYNFEKKGLPKKKSVKESVSFNSAWITSRTPKEELKVLILLDDGRVRMGYFTQNNNKYYWECNDRSFPLNRVIAWQNLPGDILGGESLQKNCEYYNSYASDITE
jgi:hypothetical protein